MMTDEKQLFDKPMDELREAFVRNRFGQTDVFGLAEIEHWVKYQRTFERPDEVIWQPFLERDFVVMCAATAPIAHLRECATQQHMQGAASEGAYWQILSLMRGGLYLGNCDVGTFVVSGSNDLFVLNSDAKGRLTLEHVGDLNPHIGARAVVDILFAEWDRQRPKWREARAFLCDALAEDIKRERANAEADFNTAVAVSADGTKIVHADWVVVMGSHECGDRTFRGDLRFPASAFQQQKILRTKAPRDEFGRYELAYTFAMEPDYDGSKRDIKRPLWTVQRLFESARDGDYPPPEGLGHTYARATFTARHRKPIGQQLLVCTDGRVLLVHRDHCPSPLPDGGVEVTI